MAEEEVYKPQWNLIEFTLLSIFPIHLSFFHIHKDLSVVIHFIFLAVICIPPLFLQFKLGGHLQKGIVGMLSAYFPIWKGVGIAALVHLMLVCIYQGPVVAEIATYMIISVAKQPYLWGTCDNAWNSNHCSPGVVSSITGLPEITNRAAYEFYKAEFWDLSDGIDHVHGFPHWRFTETVSHMTVPMLPIASASVWLLVLLMVALGGRVFGWIVTVVAPIAISCTLVVLGYGLARLDQGPTRDMLKQIFTLPDVKPTFYTSEDFLKRCMDSFVHIQMALPLWFGIAPTMGKMTGFGKIRKNLTWLLMTIMYGVFWMLPTLTMAPYLGNLILKSQALFTDVPLNGYALIFDTMATAFSYLRIPPVYALLFYLSIFLYHVLFLCVAILTLVDNIMESLIPCLERNSINKTFINVVVTFLVVGVINALGVPHTTNAGPYFNVLMIVSLERLVFLVVVLTFIGLIVVYAKQNFSLAERIMMGVWFALACLATAGLWVYKFVHGHDELHYNGNVYSQTWETISWIVSGVPFVFVVVGAIHAIMVGRGSCCQRFMGTFQESSSRSRVDNGRTYHCAEPSAPPYAYMDGDVFPMDNLPYTSDPDLDPL